MFLLTYLLTYSEEGPGRAAAPPSRLLAVPNVTAHPSTASVLTSYYSIMALYLPAPIKELIKFTCVAGLDYIVIFMAAYSLATSNGI